MTLQSLECDLSEAQEEVQKLEEDLSGLQNFKLEVKKGRSEFESQLSHKKSVVSRARGIGNSKLAVELANMFDDRLGTGFASGVSGCFDATESDVNRAIGVVEEKLRLARSQCASLETSISDEKKRLAEEESANTSQTV